MIREAPGRAASSRQSPQRGGVELVGSWSSGQVSVVLKGRLEPLIEGSLLDHPVDIAGQPAVPVSLPSHFRRDILDRPAVALETVKSHRGACAAGSSCAMGQHGSSGGVATNFQDFPELLFLARAIARHRQVDEVDAQLSGQGPFVLDALPGDLEARPPCEFRTDSRPPGAARARAGRCGRGCRLHDVEMIPDEPVRLRLVREPAGRGERAHQAQDDYGSHHRGFPSTRVGK